jgi:DNA-binding NarL/FixJ family response regulator
MDGDHPLMLAAIQYLLSQTDGMSIVGTGTTISSLIDVCEQARPDVVIVDPMSAGDAYGAIAKAIEISPQTRIVAFTGAAGVEPAIQALDAGASAYVLKRSNNVELIQAISSVQAGETYITQSFAGSVISGLREATLRRSAAEALILSDREQEIVGLLMAGKTNKEIARVIGLSETMVKHCMTRMMQKLQARNGVEVVIADQRFSEGHSSTRSSS